MAESESVIQEARIRQRIKEARASWETISKRVEAVKRDLSLELDGQRKVVLEARLGDLEQERVAFEVELERLEAALRVVAGAAFDEIEFVNREDELRQLDLERLRAMRSPYTLIGAPAGYGKSYLLQRLIAFAQAGHAVADRWTLRYVDCGSGDGNQIALVSQSLAGQATDDVDAVCDAIVQNLAARSSHGRKAVLVIFDAVERLAPASRQWVYNLLFTLRQYTHIDRREIIIVRMIIAGRNPEQFWDGYESAFAAALAPQYIYLSPFDEHPIQELIWSQARAAQIQLDDRIVVRIADQVQYLSGGHPGVIRSLLDHLAGRAFAIGSPAAYFERHRVQLVRDCVSPVVDELTARLGSRLRGMVQTLSVFRRINGNTVQALLRAGELPAGTSELGLFAEMQQAHLLVGPTIQEPFYRDHLTRRVLAMQMACQSKASAARYDRLNRLALDLYGRWILNLGKALPNSMLKSVQRLLSVVEWLFHFLQQQAVDREALRRQLLSYVRTLSTGEQVVSAADLIAGQIRQDVEVRYLLRRCLGDEGVDVVCGWLSPEEVSGGRQQV